MTTDRRTAKGEPCGPSASAWDVRQRLDKDPQFLPYFEQETTALPRYYFDLVRKDLGLLWEWLPEGALITIRTPI